jgi:hypothetical protein
MGDVNGVAVTTVRPVITPLEWVEDKTDWPAHIQRQASFAKSALNTDLKIGIDIVKDFEKHQAWQYVNQDRETFYKFGLNIDPASLPNIMEGYKVLVLQGLTPTHWRQAVDAIEPASPPNIAAKTTPRNEKGHRLPVKMNKHNNRQKHKTVNEVLISRLKRDRPDIAQRLANGEFRSVRAAARAAGFKLYSPVPLYQLRCYWRKASAEEREIFRKEITEDSRPGYQSAGN